ncbi:MAG: TIGR03943 family protein [Pseudomonadota bacterium]
MTHLNQHRNDTLGSAGTALMFLVLLGALGWLLLGGHDTAFLHPRFRPFLAAGAAILCGFAAAVAVNTHGHQPHARWWAALIKSMVLLTPVLFMSMVAGQGMGVQALSKKTVATAGDAFRMFQESGNGAGATADGTFPERSLLQIARNMKHLNGSHVVTEGMVYSDANMPPQFLLLFRFGIYCCAADAIPIWVLVDKGPAPAIENEHWVRVTGTLHVTPINGRDLPVITADDVRVMPSPAPESQYLFF